MKNSDQQHLQGHLIVQGLSREFGAKLVIQASSFEARPGDRIAIVGQNGSGKTTLLRCLANLLEPSSGTVQLGPNTLGHPAQFKANVGWSPANDGGFFPILTGRENLEFFGAYRKVSKERTRAVLGLWKALPVFADALECPFFQCSSGMKQTLRLCRALLSDPGLLLLDEPTRSLDQKTAAGIWQLIQAESSRRITIFSTHSDLEAGTQAERTFVLEQGLLLTQEGMKCASGF